MSTTDFPQIVDLSKLTAHYRSNKFVTIFIVLTLKRYCSICKEFAWVALVGVVAL